MIYLNPVLHQITMLFAPVFPSRTVAVTTAASLLLPTVAQYFIRSKSQKWKYAAGLTTGALNLWAFEKTKQNSLRTNSFISFAIAGVGFTLSLYLRPVMRRPFIERYPQTILGSIFPPPPKKDGANLFYFYIATQRGFALIFYQTSLQNSLMTQFTSGVDPLGGIAEPMLADIRWKSVPQEYYQAIVSRMKKVEGLPPFLAMQGRWVNLDSSCLTDNKLLQLLSQNTKYEEFPSFDLEVVKDTWKPITANPNLKGLSFQCLDQELIIWAHESNDQAFGSALKAKTAESRNLEQKIKQQGTLVENCDSFLQGQIARDKFLPKLPNAEKSPHSKQQIKAVKKKPPGESIQDEIECLKKNAENYGTSLERKKSLIDSELEKLRKYAQKTAEVDAAPDNSPEKSRLMDELKKMPCPTSCAQSTVQVRQVRPLNPSVIKQLLRNNLIDTVKLFRKSQHLELLKPIVDLDPFRILLLEAKDLLVLKADWIIKNPKSKIKIDKSSFDFDVKHTLGDILIPTWSQLEWLLDRFAEYESNFQMMKVVPFIDQDIEWYKSAVSFLNTLLQQTGRVTFELESELEDLAKQQKLLEEGLQGQPVYLLKRLSNTGDFIYSVTKHAKTDPLAILDEVHLPVGES